MNSSDEKQARSSGRTVRKVIAFALIALVVYCCIYSLIAKAVKGETIPMPLGFGVGVVLSGSMEPTYSVNDLILVVKTNELHEGDVIVYQTGGTSVVHRIVEKSDNGLVTTKGDANNTPDDPISAAKIKGRVVFAIPMIGAVMQLLKTVPGMIMILVFLFVLLLLSLKSKAQDDEDERKNTELRREIDRLNELINGECDAACEPEKEMKRFCAAASEQTDAPNEK